MTPLGLAANPNTKPPRVGFHGLVAGVEDPEHTPAVVVYHHDKDGRMTGLTNGGTNSLSGRMTMPTARLPPPRPRQGHHRHRKHRGLPASVEEPSTQTTNFNSYDLEGRLTQKSGRVGTTTYTYWPNGLQIT